MKYLGEAAIEIRQNMGVNQKIAAKELGVTSVYLCNIEKGKAMPSFAFLKKYEEWSGVDLYVAAWCRQVDIEKLPSSVRGVSKKLIELWGQTAPEHRRTQRNEQELSATTSKIKSPK